MLVLQQAAVAPYLNLFENVSRLMVREVYDSNKQYVKVAELRESLSQPKVLK